ncbi:PLP-dependent aminotransferase family protein [Clostridium oryzae]|uniref:2-aminoadipate transaminase n=1 Tax=Clostridium oryzae TaxID=1450648 RepID=A0A1V4IUS2_9CLOT|nr:PLP-dependent aminotransferase family protein [Clostridium oryzae]OPJ63570.1 2-aminoadipate transaminase [Clostridium oryzae]
MNEKYYIKFKDNDIPKYIQIYQYFKKNIDRGIINEGDKLPTIRQLSKDLAVNKITIINAYNRLEEEGYLYQKMGSGTYARRKNSLKMIKKQYSETFKNLNRQKLKNYIDFTGETISNSFFPVDIFRKILNDVLKRDGIDALTYQDFLGFEGLRKSIIRYFWQSRFKKDDVLIVSGAQQGIDIIAKGLINNNDNIVVEKPTYSGALAVFNWKKTNIFEIEVEPDGMNLESLEYLLRKKKIRFIYLMTYFQNPTTVTYGIDKKLKLLELAQKYEFYIIEDDYLSELIYDESIEYRSLKSLDRYDKVIYIKSFSKLFLPGIRLGYVIVPDKFKESIENAKINSDISTSSLMQRALELYLNTGHWVKHMEFLKSEYNLRYNYMKKQLYEKLNDFIEFCEPGGGLNFFIKLKENVNISSMELFQKCKANKVLITPGGLFYKDYTEGNKFFRISFSQTDNESISTGITVIYNILSQSIK